MNAIKQTKKLVVKLNNLHELELHGFHKKEVFSSSIHHIYVNYDLKIVVKEQWVVGKMPPRVYRVPTERFRCKASNWDMMTIQALADTREQSKAMWELSKMHVTQDLRPPNAAWYNDKPVFIDW